jgi:hypothetical protein
MQTVSTFLTFASQETVLDEWEILDDRGNITFGDILAVLVGLLFYIVPGLFVIAGIVLRPKRKGYLCLTNWRFIYYEKGEGLLRTYYFVASANLEDVVGIHSVYNQGWFGTTSLAMTVHTRFEDNVAIAIGQTGGLLSKIPLIGKLFRRSTMGKDALGVPPILFSLVHQSRLAAADPSSRF